MIPSSPLLKILISLVVFLSSSNLLASMNCDEFFKQNQINSALEVSTDSSSSDAAQAWSTLLLRYPEIMRENPRAGEALGTLLFAGWGDSGEAPVDPISSKKFSAFYSKDDAKLGGSLAPLMLNEDVLEVVLQAGSYLDSDKKAVSILRISKVQEKLRAELVIQTEKYRLAKSDWLSKGPLRRALGLSKFVQASVAASDSINTILAFQGSLKDSGYFAKYILGEGGLSTLELDWDDLNFDWTINLNSENSNLTEALLRAAFISRSFFRGKLNPVDL